MSNASKLITLQEKINEFSHTLYAAQMKKFEHVAEVYDSDKLSGLSLEEVKTILRNKVLDHMAKKNTNVHNVTPEQLNTLSDIDMQNELDKMLDKVSSIPLSYYSHSISILDDESNGTWVVKITKDVPVMINGRYGIIPKTDFTFNPTDDQWGEWHLWAYRDGNNFKYRLTKEVTTQPNDDHLYIGFIHTKGRSKGVFRVHVERAISIGGYRVSRWSAGKSIPISEGAVNASKHLNWI